MPREIDFEQLNRTVTEAIARYGPDSGDRFFEAILNAAVWEWTEREGKYSTGYVTLAALAQRDANRRAGRWVHQDLQHEHVVTKKYLKDRMRLVGDATPLKEATACVVTKAEHKAMRSTAHGWQRYLDSGIVVLRDSDLSPVDIAQMVADQEAGGAERHRELMDMSDEELFEEQLHEGGGG